MRIRYFSDLHLEFKKSFDLKKINPNKEEICILAGDIGYPSQKHYYDFLNYINNSFKKTFLVPGNHEYYDDKITIEENKIILKNLVSNFKNITLLDKQVEYYNGYKFIGATLWSHIYLIRYTISDKYRIPEMTIERYNKIHQEEKEFIEQELKEDINSIVITHHLPSYHLIQDKYINNPTNDWFASNMNNIIRENNHKIKAWVYGHTHTPLVKDIEGVTTYCNPIGYPDENEVEDYDKKIEIDF